jgi:demethylmenaquinone methyltransferase / 2-methoxy-6-polyprenyl-1,4-benzoquinol methylase
VPNAFYEEGPERSAKVHSLFGAIAGHYDLLNDLQSFGLHRAWKRRVVELSHVKKGDRALDVCCGTGDLALALAGAGAEATGLDFNQPMLDVAKRRDVAGAVRWMRGDALRIPFEDETFDVVTIGYGLRNLASWQRGLKEMCRVLKPGGRLLILEFAQPPNAFWRALYFGYLKGVVPVLGKIFAGSAEAYGYILESLKHYPSAETIADHLGALCCHDVRVVRFLGGVMTIHCAIRSSRNS